MTEKLTWWQNTPNSYQRWSWEVEEALANWIYNQEAQELIRRCWWKNASLIYQYKHWWSKYMIPFSVFEVVDWEVQIPDKFKNFQIPEDENLYYNPVFLRWSGIWDEKWQVWVLKSEATRNGYSVEEVIEDIVNEWKDEKTLSYIRNFDRNADYTWISSISASEQLWLWLWTIQWSIIEHPNIRWHYVINFLWWKLEVLVDWEWVIKKENCTTSIYRWDLIDIVKQKLYKNLIDIVKMKKDTDNSWFINWKTSQTEFTIVTDQMKNFVNGDIEEISLVWGAKLKKRDLDYEYAWKLESNVVFLQQREFRNYSEEELELNNYKFNCFWIYPEWLFTISDYEIKGETKVPEEDFELMIEWAIFTKWLLWWEYKRQSPNEIQRRNRFYELINSPNLKWITFVKDNDWGAVWSLEHWCYRYLSREIPVKTIYK